MDSEQSKEVNVDKTLVNKLLKKLTNLFYDELKTVCDLAGYHIADLMPKPKESFVEKGSPSDVESLRFLHYEENRIAKIMKISSDIAVNPESHLHKSPSTILLMKQLNLNVVAQKIGSRTASLNNGEAHKSFHRPQDIIQYNYEREKEKYHRSLKMIEKISGIKEEALRRKQEKIKRIEDRDKKLQADKMKKDEEHEKYTQMQNEKRKNILQKKYQIEENIKKQCCDIGILLEKRMNQLSEKDKKVLREKIRRNQEKIRERINNDFQKSVMDEIRIKDEEKEVEKMMQELQVKIESRVRQYESNVKKRVQTARCHSVKVEQRFTQNLIEENQKQEEKLKKMIDKTMKSEEKKDKKATLSKENAEKMKTEIEKSFDRHNRGVKDINEAEIKRLEDIEQRENDKRKSFNIIKSQIKVLYLEKKHQNSYRERKQSAKYSRTQENYVKNT